MASKYKYLHPEHERILKARQYLDGAGEYQLATAVGLLEQSYEYFRKQVDTMRAEMDKGHEYAWKRGYSQGKYYAKSGDK